VLLSGIATFLTGEKGNSGTMLSKSKALIKIFLTNNLQRFFLNQARDVTDSLPVGPLLIIAPHPDDETLGCAGITALFKAQGSAVRIIIVTDGSHADMPEGPSKQELSATRRKESILAAGLLGIPMENVVFLDYKDWQTSKHVRQIAEDIASQIWLNPPACLLTPHGIDAHPDHRAVARAIQILCDENKIACPILEYPMWFWPKGGLKHLFNARLLKTHRKVNISSYMSIKQTAIDAHVCQKDEANWAALIAYHIAGQLHPYELFFEKPQSLKK